MVGVRQNLVLQMVQMVTYVRAYDVSWYLAYYGRDGHRTVVGGIITCSLVEDGRHPRVLPGAREQAVEGLIQGDSNGRAEVIREFLQDSGWNFVRSCCFLRVQIPQELTGSRF